MEGENIIQGSLFGPAKLEVPAARSRKEVFEDYDGFVEKFKPKKTTDDCYTPEAVYDAVLDYVRSHWDVEGRVVCRPFWPGYDYTRYDYPEGCVVIDNPPFSILSKIIRHYCSRGIDFFLFAPSLTLFAAQDCDLTYIISDSDVTYANGAVVKTGFITSLPCDYRIVLDHDLREAIEKAQKKAPKTKRGFIYPDTLVTASILSKIVTRGVSLRIRKDECAPIRRLDSDRSGGRDLFGGGTSYLPGRQRNGRQRNGRQRNGRQRNGRQRNGRQRNG